MAQSTHRLHSISGHCRRPRHLQLLMVYCILPQIVIVIPPNYTDYNRYIGPFGFGVPYILATEASFASSKEMLALGCGFGAFRVDSQSSSSFELALFQVPNI